MALGVWYNLIKSPFSCLRKETHTASLKDAKIKGEKRQLCQRPTQSRCWISSLCCCYLTGADKPSSSAMSVLRLSLMHSSWNAKFCISEFALFFSIQFCFCPLGLRFQTVLFPPAQPQQMPSVTVSPPSAKAELYFYFFTLLSTGLLNKSFFLNFFIKQWPRLSHWCESSL